MRFLCTVLLVTVVHAAPTREEQAAGWHVLFDGSSTDAWRGYKQPGFPAQGWVVEDGALRHVKSAGGGDIITKRRYRNFELRLEWRVGLRGNSGIMYGVAEGDGASYMTGPEYQILDDPGRKARPEHSAGALYALYAAPEDKPVKAAGDWNTARIVIDGARVEHWLNGMKVVEARIGSDDWNARVAKSKFAKWKGFGTVRRGHICLQDHGDDVWYRNMRIRELSPEEARHGERVVLFDGKGLDRWSAHLRGGGALEDVWSVQDGELVCKGRPPGYIYTNEDFKNFVLRVEWRWPGQPGNSGVLFRMTGEHKVWPRSIEAQLMSGNAGDFWNIGGVPMQVVAARTRGRNTKKTHGNEKPPGEWNRYDIVVDDGWVQLRVNGEVLNEAWDAEEIAGRICLQSEGAEIRFRTVELVKLKD